MADISQITPLATSTPEDAATHINNASVFGVPPSNYKDFKSELDPQAAQLSKPTEASDSTAQFMQQSTEHASLAMPDVEHMSYLDRQIKSMSDAIFDKPTVERQVIALSNKKMYNGDKLSDDDQMQLDNLNFQRAEMAKRNYGLDGPVDKIPTFVAGAGEGVVEMGRQIGENSQSMVGKIISKLPMFGPALSLAYGMGKGMFDQYAGSMHNELSNMTDANGKPLNIDPETKKYLSMGVGAVGTAINVLAPEVIAEASPLIRQFTSPILARAIVSNPMMAAVKAATFNLSKAGVTMAGAAAGTEMTKILAEEMGRASTETGGLTDASFLNAIHSTTQKLNEYAPRVAGAAASGFGAGVLLGAPLEAVGFGATRDRFQGIHDFVENTRASNAKDVTPTAPLQLEAPRNGVSDAGPDVTPQLPGDGPVHQSVKVLQLQEAMANMSKVADQTNMSKVAPGQLSSYLKSAFDNAGLSKVWISGEDALKYINDSKRGEAARNIIDPSGVASAQANSPVSIEPHKFMELLKEFPEAKDALRVQPDGPNSVQAKKFLEDLNSAHEQRQEVFDKLGLTDADLAKPAESNVTQLTPKPRIDMTSEATVAITQRVGELNKLLEHPEITEEERANITTERNGLVDQVKSHYGMHDGKVMIADWAQDAGKVAQEKENDYMTKSIFPSSLAENLPKSEIEKFSAAQMEARKSVQADIHAAAANEQTKVMDLDEANAREVQYQTETARIAQDPRFDVVDKFITAPKNEKGKLAYSIDPKLMTPEQVKAFANAPYAKTNKLFAKGGVSPQEAAQMLGVANGDMLMQIVGNTPRRAVVIRARVQAHNADIARQVAENATPDNAGLIKAFTNNTANHIAEMKFMREQEWPATKAGIKRIALPLPHIQELAAQARAIVSQTKVGDLSIAKFRMGERSSQKVAVNAILKNEVDKAFLAKEAAALNSELQKEAYVAVAHVNKVYNFARRFNDPSVMNELRDAGKSYLGAANEILDVFNLNPSKKGVSEQGDFVKWVKEQVALGNGNFEIPERLSDVRQHSSDLTVEQTELIGDRLKAILYQARMKNRLLNKWEGIEESRNELALATELHANAETHPDYDPSRIPSVQEANIARETVGDSALKTIAKTTAHAVHSTLATGQSLLNNLEHIVITLDQEKLNGMWHDVLVKPIKGDGEFNGKQGESGWVKDMVALKGHFEAQIKEFGEKEFNALANTMHQIKEFEGNRAFGNGVLSRLEVMKIAANMGDPDGRANLVKMGVDFNTLQAVLTRELSTKEVLLVQNLFVNTIQSYADRSVALEKLTTGQDVTLVKGVPWEHDGKVVPGGYFPQRYRVDFQGEMIKSTMNAMKDKSAAILGLKDSAVYARQYAAEMTEQGRHVERVGSDKPLDLSPTGFTRIYEEILHDLNYRVPVRDTLKVLKNETTRADIMSIVGPQKYGVILNTIVEAANRIDAENANYFNDQNRFMKSTFGHLQSGFSVGVLAYNTTSTAVQLVSLVSTMQKMGPKGPLYIANTLRQMLRNLHQIKGFYDFAAEINPSIAAHMDGVENRVSTMMHDLLPTKSRFPKLGPALAAKDWVIQLGMSPMAWADQFIKVTGSLAAYEQARSGDAEGIGMSIVGMSPEEQHQVAMDHARAISRTTLTHGADTDRAPIQKLPVSDLFIKFWNDLRNVFNNTMSQSRKIKWGSKETFENLKEGDYTGAKTAAVGVAAGVGGLVISATLIKAYEDWIRGRPTPMDQKFDMHTAEGQRQAAAYMTKYMLGSPLEIGVESIPFVKDIKYGADYGKRGHSDTRNVGIPMNKIQTDIATTWGAVEEMYSASRTSPSPTQFKAGAYAASYIFGGFPVNAAYKFAKWQKESETVTLIEKGVADKLHATLDSWISKPPSDASPADIQHAKDLQAQIAPQMPATVPVDTLQTIQKIQGGTYQFSSEQWKAIAKEAPELGLTENGRVSSNSTQLESAMKWQTQHNAEQLHEKDLPVNSETLYGAHVLGLDQTEKLYRAAADSKVKTVIGAKALDGIQGLENLKTVGQVRKAIKSLVSSNKLTSTAENEQD